MLKIKDVFLVFVVALVIVITSFGSVSAEWPERAISLVLVSPAGGAVDRGLRPLSKLLQDELGTPIAVMDMSGSAGAIAADWVRRQPADGYSWVGQAEFLLSNAIFGQYDHLYSDWWNYIATGTPVVISVRKDSPIKDFGDLLERIKNNPGQVSFSTPQTGTTHNLAVEYLKYVTNLDFNVVPYPGGGPGIRALMTREVEAVSLGLTPQVPFIESGDVLPLVAFTKEPFELKGYGAIAPITDFIDKKDLQLMLPWTNYQMILVRRDTPEDIMVKIDAAWEKVMQKPEIDKIAEENAFITYKIDRHNADEYLKNRTILQAWIIEKILGINVKTRDELGIPKFEDM